MKKIKYLPVLLCSMLMLSGCGDKTTVVSCHDSGEAERVVEHIPVSSETTAMGESIPRQQVQHMEVSQVREAVRKDEPVPVRVTEHVPVTQNYYTTVQNDNSRAENNTVNYKQEENTDVEIQQSVEYNANSKNHVKMENNTTEDDESDIEEPDDTENGEEQVAKKDDTATSELTATPEPTVIPPEPTEIPDSTETPMPTLTETPMLTPEPTETLMPTPEPTETSMLTPEPTETPMPTPEPTETPTASVTPDVKNTKPAVPVVSEWKKIWDSAEETFPKSDGVTYQITWDKITGADGYEVELQSRDSGNEQWNSRTITVTEPSYRESFSHIDMQLKARVRAFRKTGITKEYGDWSQEKQLNYSPV